MAAAASGFSAAHGLRELTCTPLHSPDLPPTPASTSSLAQGSMAQTGEGGTVIAGFLHERLAAAQAIPAAQRTPELAGFIESCQLKNEVAALLAQPLPSGAAAAAEEQARRTQQAALRLLRADMLCVAAPLDEYNGAHQWAVDHFKQMLSSMYWWQLGVPPFADWHTRIMAFGRQIAGSQLSASSRLDRFLLLAAGLPPPPITQQLPMLRLLLDMMAQPEERAALEPALVEAQAGLPAPLLTWDQLAGRLAEHTAHCCMFSYLQLATMGQLPGNDPVFAATARWVCCAASAGLCGVERYNGTCLLACLGTASVCLPWPAYMHL